MAKALFMAQLNLQADVDSQYHSLNVLEGALADWYQCVNASI